MAAPLTPQGVLNRVRGSVTVSLLSYLNVTASYLGREGINLSFSDEAATNIGTMTGTVPSPAPYQMATLEFELLKTQDLADRYKKQVEVYSAIGPVVVRPDVSSGLSNYFIDNCVISMASPGRLNGSSVSFMVSISGSYLINNALYLQS